MIYQFSMYPLEIRRGTKPTMVWTTEPEMMRTFLKQHGFDPTLSKIQIFKPTEDFNKPIRNEVMKCMLNRYIFGGRDDKTHQTVVTTEEIMNSVVTNVAIDLSGCMWLGACALRGDIQVFERISNLIDELDPIYVKDLKAADSGNDGEEEGNLLNQFDRLAARLSEYPFYESIAMQDDDTYLYERLYDSVRPDVVQMITLESYVSIFTKLYIIGHDDYDRPRGDEFDV